jgi:hypothetical protein
LKKFQGLDDKEAGKFQGGNMKKFQVVTASLLLATPALADGPGMMANPMVSSRPGVASGPVSRTGTGNVTIKLVNSCFGTNNRSVSNPLSPNSTIKATIPITVTTGGTAVTTNFFVNFPGEIVTAAGAQSPDKDMDPATYGADKTVTGLKASIGGNIVQLSFPGRQLNVNLSSDGVENDTNTSQVTVGALSFYETITDCSGGPVYGSYGYSSYTPTYPCGAYMGKTGALTAAVNAVNIASDSSMVEIEAAFPGQTGFCGGYFSPLMLFFGKERPVFNGSSEFKLSSAGKTFWVEKDAPGFFLVLDRNGNGKIDDATELFGSQDSETNGFEELKKLDSNKDGVIDHKDKMWSKLMLWHDKNGDGISQPGELEPLSKRVTKISLKYKAVNKAYGSTAQARQVAEFWFKDGKKIVKGEIEDIWFAPDHEHRAK